MASLAIFGPAGDPNAAAPPTQYQLVPFEADVEQKKANDKAADQKEHETTKQDVLRSGEQVTLLDPKRAVDAEAGGLDDDVRRRR